MKGLFPLINRRILKQRIKEKTKNNDLDFISFIVTPWHLMGLEAELLKNDTLNNGIVIILPHPKDGILINEKNLSSLKSKRLDYYILDDSIDNSINSKVRGVFLKIFTLLKCAILNNRNRDYKIKIISPLFLDLNNVGLFSFQSLLQNQISFLLIDEGIGTYAPKSFWEYINAKERGNQKNINRVIREKLIEIIKRRGLVEYQFLFTLNDDKKLIEDKSVVEKYKNLLFGERINNVHEKNETKKALIATQPLSENNIITLEKEIESIENSINKIYNDFDKIFIKAHPREMREKYLLLSTKYKKIEVLDQKVSIEKIILDSRPQVIIGFNSTALINAKVFFNIPAYTISDYIINDIKSSEYKKQFCYIQDIFSLLVLNIRDFNSRN